MQGFFNYFFHIYRICNGDRTWKNVPGVDPKPQYDCAAFGQLHYRTFDGLTYKVDGQQCQYILMSDCRSNGPFCDLEAANINVRVRNTRCINSFEAYMCKEVTIELRLPGGKAEIVMLQQTVTVKFGVQTLTFNKGTYPQPRTAVLDGLEIFKVNYACIFYIFTFSFRCHTMLTSVLKALVHSFSVTEMKLSVNLAFVLLTYSPVFI